MSEKIINVQDALLNYIRKNKVPVTIFLMNGVKITGIISCFDQSSVVVRKDGYIQLIYKHAISTFSPHGAVSIFDWNVQQGGNGDYRQPTRQPRGYQDEAEDDEEIMDDDEEFEEVDMDEDEEDDEEEEE
jgi:host factor-I protein